MFRADIIRTKYTNFCIYSASWWWANKCSKHVEAIGRNKLKTSSASCWSYYTDRFRCTVNKTWLFDCVSWVSSDKCLDVLSKNPWPCRSQFINNLANYLVIQLKVVRLRTLSNKQYINLRLYSVRLISLTVESPAFWNLDQKLWEPDVLYNTYSL
jgi:hypothetical protein